MTEEVVDVCSQHVGVGQHDVVRSIVLSCGVNDFLGILEVAGQSLNLLQNVGGLLSLGEESILDHARISVEQSRRLSPEVLQYLKSFVADGGEILVADGCCLLVAVARCLCRGLGVRRRCLGN